MSENHYVKFSCLEMFFPGFVTFEPFNDSNRPIRFRGGDVTSLSDTVAVALLKFA